MEGTKPGIYDARVVDYGIGSSKKGAPMAMIRFEFMDESSEARQMNWYGSFNGEKASEISCEALAICGWTTNNPADLSKGSGSGVLDENNSVSITLKNEEYNGKITLKIAYINPLGGAGFRDVMNHGEAVQAFQGMNLGGIAAAARKKHAPKVVPNYAPGSSNTGNVPF